MTTLKLLLKNITNIELPDINISGLTLDSRKVKSGDIFFAYRGQSIDSKQFINQVIAKGAAAILCDTPQSQAALTWKKNIPIISIPDLKEKIGLIAARFYDNPSRDMLIIGITGTNGKTSISYLLASALQKLGRKKVGLIGTLGYGTIEALTPSIYTSPNPIMLQRILYDFKQQGIDTVIMELSSHALDQKRFAGINIKFGTFTNLTHDHLDYHQNITQYEAAKRILFEMPSIQYGIFNLDDPVGLKWFKQFQNNFTAYGYTLHSDKVDINQNMSFALCAKPSLPDGGSQGENRNSPPESPCANLLRAGDINKEQVSQATKLVENLIVANNFQAQSNRISADITTPWGNGKLTSPLLGRFNISNLLAVISNLCLLKYNLNKILSIIPTLQSVPGRVQTFSSKNKPLVVVDFSHTPDALQQALQTLQEHCQGKLFCVFGCGGDRDRDKRPKMAEIAEKLADHVIVTNDNVRFEDPQQIADDILAGFTHPNLVQVELDRQKAITATIQQAHSQDIVLLAGKGHEPYQIIGDKRLPFSDIEIVKNLFAESD
jgi:UDP-N-acetylmuramoyl-L-alanyl-D-glutamate--2,6-diaminopimelate ligase